MESFAAARARKCRRLIAAQRAGQAAAEVPLGCLARLQRAFDVGHAGPGPRSGTAPVAVPGLVEQQLTSRELEVLTMLAAGTGRSRRRGKPGARHAVRRRNDPAPGQDLAQVVEHDHAVAEQAPSLLGVRSHGAGGGTVRAVSRRARG